MNFITLTLKKSASKRKAEKEIKEILQKIANANPSVLTAVKVENIENYQPYYQILTNAEIDKKIFDKWDGRIQEHKATSYENVMKYFASKNKATFLQ